MLRFDTLGFRTPKPKLSVGNPGVKPTTMPNGAPTAEARGKVKNAATVEPRGKVKKWEKS